MICPTCKINKPKREFRLRVRYDETKPRYGIACNECRSNHNQPNSSAAKLTDAYCAWMIRQGHFSRHVPIDPELIKLKRLSIQLKRELRKLRENH
jgi:hypothetical protein